MTAQFPLAHHPDVIAHHRPGRRHGNGTASIALCWLVAALGLAGSYWLDAIAHQAASCLFGLLGAAAAMVLTLVGRQR